MALVRILKHIFALILLAVSMISCFPTRNVPANQYLYQSNSYKIVGEKIGSHDISSYYLQKTNRKILLLKPYLKSYDFGTRFKDSSLFNVFFSQTLGEPPVLFDSSLVDATAENIQGHLFNLGYYNARVVPEVSTYDYLKVAFVKYLVYPNTPYKIRQVNFDIEGKSVRSFVLADWSKSYLDTGLVFSLATLKKERDRITNNMRNLGYYYFNKSQISFVADSSFRDFTIDLTLKIDKQSIKTADSLIKVDNKQYKFNKIYIHTEIGNNDPLLPFDTTVYSYDYDHSGALDYYFVHQGEMRVNPKAILQSIYIKPTRFFKNDDVAQSYQALYNLNIYNYVNISIKDLLTEEKGYGQLDVIIQLSKLLKFNINSDSEVKNTGGQYGIEQGFGILSRNTFGNGEIFKVNLRGALEVQSLSNSNSNPNTIFKVFNTFEAGINSSLEIPQFLAPVKRNFFSRYFNPKTKFDVGYNYQDRPDYTRMILNGNFGYRWVSSVNKSHILNPFELSSVTIKSAGSFQSVIDNYADPRIKYSYQDHMVLGMSYSYTYNERKAKSKKPFKFFFAKIELGGMPYNLFSNLVGDKKDSLGQYQIGRLPYTQFTRFETDFRYYLPVNNGTLMHAFRANFGIAIPLSGAVAVPFEKSFYIGGANSLRAWTIGTLGPGSFVSGSNTFEMTGDIRLEMNYEFRFPILGSSLMGAVFTDVGNVFLLKESDALIGGTFYFDDFYKKLAADVGYGLRFDLSFLVIRFDIAHPVYQPYRTKGNRWSMVSSGVDPKLIWAFNFAIGYPF